MSGAASTTSSSALSDADDETDLSDYWKSKFDAETALPDSVVADLHQLPLPAPRARDNSNQPLADVNLYKSAHYHSYVDVQAGRPGMSRQALLFAEVSQCVWQRAHLA